MTLTRWQKYAAFVQVGAARALTERSEIYGRMLLLPVILGIFSALWGVVPRTHVAHTPQALVWYLALTEWILLSPPLVFTEIQEDIVCGDIAVHLPRPVSYIGAIYCQAIGGTCVRALALGVLTIAFARLWTGTFPEPGLLAWALPLGFCASLLIVAMYVALGLSAFWVVDVMPLYMVWHKALFILGGLILPLEFYPTWVQRWSALTPFPAVLAGPAGLVLHPPAAAAVLGVALRIAFWFCVVGGAAHWLFRRALVRLQLNGG